MQREFITMVTHELRNPLASIKGYAELMQRRGAYSEAAVDTIVTQAKQLERLIEDLLDVSRLQVGQLKLQPGETDLVALARAAAAQAQTLTHVHTIRVVAPEPPLVGRWDATRLEQVLQNLLSNAVKYSPDGGEIVVRVEDLPRQARVSVTDQGIGIPPEALPRLFQRFFRTEEAQARGIEGLGLGLHISRALVEAHGGRLWAESLPGQGSTFVFTLPRQER
jgi:signal transduction histidine kinase